jgi:hypothetical protein
MGFRNPQSAIQIYNPRLVITTHDPIVPDPPNFPKISPLSSASAKNSSVVMPEVIDLTADLSDSVLMEDSETDSSDEEDAQEPEDFHLLTTPPGGTTPPEGTVLQVSATELEKFHKDVNWALINNLETPPSRAPPTEPPPLLHPAVTAIAGTFSSEDSPSGFPTSMDRCTLCTTEQDLEYWQDGQWFCPLCFQHKQEIDDLPSLVCDHCGMNIVQSTTEPDMKRTHWYVHHGDTYLAGRLKKICYVCHEHALGISPYYAGTPHNNCA